MSGRGMATLAIIGFIISLIVWNMMESRNSKARGDVIDKMISECESNITFLDTGKHDRKKKDYVDDALTELQTSGVQKLDTYWLNVLANDTFGIFMKSDTAKKKLEAYYSLVNVYNRKYVADKYSDYYGNEEEYSDYTENLTAPSKDRMKQEIRGMMTFLRKVKDSKNNFKF